MKQQKMRVQHIVWITALVIALASIMPGVSVWADKESDWHAYRGASDNNATVLFDTPQKLATELRWAKMFGELGEWGTNSKSSFVIVGDYLYFASEDTLYKVDADGNSVGEMTLSGMVGYTALPLYETYLIVPLDGGALEAVDPDAMTSVWVSESPALEGEYLQNGNALAGADGVVYSLTQLLDDNWMSVKGYVQAVDIATGESLWVLEDVAEEGAEAGYNLTGAYIMGDKLVVAGEKGVIQLLDRETGEILATESLDTKIKSLMVEDGGVLYFSSFEGRLLAYELLDNTFVKKLDIPFSIKSNATPVIFDGKAYLGGLLEFADWEAGTPATGVFAVIDLEKEAVIDRFEVEGEVQSSALLVADSSGQYVVYFTVNNEVGALHAYDGQALQVVFTPSEAMQQYTMFSPVTDGAGVIYYANDSGHVFALEGKAEAPPATEPAPQETDTKATEKAETTTPVTVVDEEAAPSSWLLPAGIAVAVLIVAFIVWRAVNKKKD